MTTFTIDVDNNITALGSDEQAKDNPEAERFGSAQALASLAEKWPATRLVEIWNSLPGQTPVKRFTSRKAAVGRVWKAIQSLAPDSGPQAPRVASKKARPGKQTSGTRKRGTARKGSKTAKILDLLKRPGGTTLKGLMAATKWQAHSVRGFLSGTVGKGLGLRVKSNKEANSERTYSIKA